MHMCEKLCQCRRNHRVKHIVVGEIPSPCKRLRCHKIVYWLCYLNFFDPMHSDVKNADFVHTSVLTFTFQLWISNESGKFSKPHFWDWKSRVIDHAIMRVNSSSMTQRGSKCQYLDCWNVVLVLTNSAALVSHLSTFHDISSSNWSQSARRWCQIPWILEESWGWSFSGRPSKTFPEIHIVCRVPSGNPESCLSIPMGLGIFKGWLGCSNAARCLRIVKILLLRPKNSPCSVNPEFWGKSWLTIVGFLSCCMDNSSILICLARSVSSQQFLRNSSISWRIMVQLSWKSLFSLPVLRKCWSFLSEPDLPIDSPGAGQVFEIRVLDCFRKVATSEFPCYQILMFISASASDNLFWAPWTASSAFCSK